ncbi:hypothetical protein N2599_13905 [Rhizobium sullae]|uniref:Uncharacterized protein n=1 Tax=Rhizobium sullae TaxID=50338 RepID=A0ABY5XH09_RHISU|nr:hypothetical protein [Rhizobium sullae]UWU13238.1 hypothetical protein N2599_13905 [Rhizobium sullae]
MNFNWKKAGLRHQFVKPLPPGETACTQYPVAELNNIDDDAPITYGNNNTVQRASIYGKNDAGIAAGQQRYTSKISSSYSDESGVKRHFEVSFFFDSDGASVTKMGLAAPEDLYVAIANVGDYWSELTIDSLAGAAKQQKGEVNFQTLPAFAADKGDAGSFFADWEKIGSEAIIVKGSIQEFGAGKSSGTTGLTEMVIFDDQKQPIASTFVALPVTKFAP